MEPLFEVLLDERGRAVRILPPEVLPDDLLARREEVEREQQSASPRIFAPIQFCQQRLRRSLGSGGRLIETLHFLRTNVGKPTIRSGPSLKQCPEIARELPALNAISALIGVPDGRLMLEVDDRAVDPIHDKALTVSAADRPLKPSKVRQEPVDFL